MLTLTKIAPVTVRLVWVYMLVLVMCGGILAWPTAPLGTETEAFGTRS